MTVAPFTENPEDNRIIFRNLKKLFDDIKGKNIVVATAKEMENAVKSEINKTDALIMSAAVSDFRAKNISEQKIKKTDSETMTIELVKNPDILKEVCSEKSKHKKFPLVVGFCAESENLIENAKTKIQKKGCDFIVANDISRKDIGFNSDENEVYIIDKELNINKLEKNTKQKIAKNILKEIFNFSKTTVMAD